MEWDRIDEVNLPEPSMEIGKFSSKGEIKLKFSEDMLVPEDKDFDYSGVFEIVLSSSDGSRITGRYLSNANRRRNLKGK